MAWKSYKEESKANWGEDTFGNICLDQVRTGAILRIADSLEIMALNHQKLIEERDRYKRWYEEQKQLKEIGRRSEAALRGVITKLKKSKR